MKQSRHCAEGPATAASFTCRLSRAASSAFGRQGATASMNRPTRPNCAIAGVDARRRHYSRDARAKAIDRLALVDSAESLVLGFLRRPSASWPEGTRAAARREGLNFVFPQAGQHERVQDGRQGATSSINVESAGFGAGISTE